MKPETRFYLIAAIIALALMGSGYYLISCGGAVNVVFGAVLLIVGILIGILVFGERWDVPF